MKKILQKLKNSKHGFSLVELIVVIAIMAVIAAVLVPSLLMHVEESRAEKDIKTTDEMVTAVELALADQDVYDELVEHSVFDNVSCYVDKNSESGYEKTVIKETYNGHAEQYMFDNNARQNDEVPYYGAGNMRGLTITFSPEKDSNESTYELSRGIINRFVGRKTGYLYENEKLYNAIRSVIGDTIKNSSQTYRNSDFTIFIRLGSVGGNEAGNQDATQVWGQYNGTNLPADTVQTAKITTDRVVGDAGQYDKDVNDYINDEANTDIDFSQLAAMGGSSFGKELQTTVTDAPGLYKPNGDFISWKDLTSMEYCTISNRDTCSFVCIPEQAILTVDKNGVLKSACIDDNLWCCDDMNISDEYIIGKLVIGDNVKVIDKSAFAAFDLTSVVIPNSVTIIEDYAFNSCDNLESVILSEGLVKIGDGSFASCVNLKSITIPNSVTTIGSSAFCKTALKSIHIPANVNSIGTCAFSGPNLELITVDENNSIYDSRNNCNAIMSKEYNGLVQGCKNTTIPNDTASLQSFAFAYSTGLKSIDIPNGVTSIGQDVFAYCTNLESVTIPDSVTIIRDWAFRECTKLRTIYLPSNVRMKTANNGAWSAAFLDCSPSLKIYCGATSKPSNWDSYWNYYDQINALSTTWNVTREQYESTYRID